MTTRNLFASSSSGQTGAANPFASSSSKPNPFGGGGTSTSGTSPFGGGGSTSTTTQPANPFGSMGGANTTTSNIMYLSSNNPNRHSKLSTFPEHIKKGFYFIENKFENNERYQDAFTKESVSTNEDMTELKDQTNEAVKSVKSAWNALSNVNHQVKVLQEELENNQNVVDEMRYVLDQINKGSTNLDVPSTFFVNLLSQFESRLSQYKKRIEEMEEIINSSLEKENQKQRLVQEGNVEDEAMEYEDQNQGGSTNSSLLYQVLHLLYNNFCTVANQIEAVNEMVEAKELKMKKFLERNSSMTQNEIERLFEFKESESDTMMKSLNALATKNSIKSFEELSLDDRMDDPRKLGKKRKAYDVQLIPGETDRMSSMYSPYESHKRYRTRDDLEGTAYYSKRRNDFGMRGLYTERKYF